MAALEHLSAVIHSWEGYFWNMTFQMHTFNSNYTKSLIRSDLHHQNLPRQ